MAYFCGYNEGSSGFLWFYTGISIEKRTQAHGKLNGLTFPYSMCMYVCSVCMYVGIDI